MKYTVTWKPAAEHELALLWTNAVDRNAVTMGADEIDRVLRVDPLNLGESRTGSKRILFIHPLGVIFKVDEQDRNVSVLQVWSTIR